MENFIKIFKTIWEHDIKSTFEKGIITYERQLQAILYNLLRERLTYDYEIFIEPVIYQLDKIKPDMVITKSKKIIAIIELKCKPWEYPKSRLDINKLLGFKDKIDKNVEIYLGWIPKFIDWNEQNNNITSRLAYGLDEKLQLIIAVIAKHDSEIVSKEIKDFDDYEKIKDFKIFLGYINPDGSIEFKMK